MMKLRPPETACLLVSCIAICGFTAIAQTNSNRGARVQASSRNEAKSESPAIEPHVLHVLKVMSNQLQAAQNYSFQAHIMREEAATNGQMLDFFTHIRVEVKRPDKMRLTVKSDNSETNLWYDGKTVTLMHPKTNLYTPIPAPPTIDATVQMLKDKLETHMYLTPFLVNNSYPHWTDGLKSANVVGFVDIGKQRFLQMAFREDDADWQLWVTGPQQILPNRLAITYKTEPGAPRVYVDLYDWNLNAQTADSAFVFSKPQGAVQVSLDALRRKGPNQSERKTHEKK